MPENNGNMKGLDVAEDFFLHWGIPALEEEFPDLLRRISAGRFSGSDVLRADDDISKDHNWGPQFTLFLSQDDFEKFATHLSQTMNEKAPPNWNGYRVDGAGDKNVLVENVPEWVEKHIGFAAFPQSDSDWNIVVRHRRLGGTVEARESALYYLRYGALWLDNNEEFGRWRKVLEKYPDTVWYARLAEECFRMWQYGQYNFIQRISKRDDPLAVSLCLGEFVEGVMRMLLLLYRHYTPYWKWLAHEFRRVDRASHYAPLLETLVNSDDRVQQVNLVKQICDDIYQELLSIGVISKRGTHEQHLYEIHLVNAQLELLDKVPWMPTIT
jgi:hypothetical protein